MPDEINYNHQRSDPTPAAIEILKKIHYSLPVAQAVKLYLDALAANNGSNLDTILVNYDTQSPVFLEEMNNRHS